MVQRYWYLASPYSSYPFGRDQACTDVCAVAAALFAKNILVYSPIAHTHALAAAHKLPGDAAFWKDFNEALMAPAIGCIVPQMPTWYKSVGVHEEIDFFSARGKPIIYLTFPALRLVPSSEFGADREQLITQFGP